MAFFYDEPSHTFGEYLLIPGYTSADCIPEHVSLRTPVTRFNKKAGEEFLAKNSTAEGVELTPKGVQYLVVRPGNGKFPTSIKDTVKVSYEGSTLDGKVFDSSYERNDTVSFPLNRVIEGWQDGLQHCDEGSEVTLWIPSELAYGPRGPMGPNQTLKFKVELHEVLPFVEKEEEAK